METIHGHIAYKTETAVPITVRDDLDASIVLSHEIYLLTGEPWTEPMSGNAFGGKIKMKRLTFESKATYRFFYKIAGLEMDWQSFVPRFFPESTDFQKRDLSLLDTYRWMEQADLAKQNIGFIHIGHNRYTVSDVDVAKVRGGIVEVIFETGSQCRCGIDNHIFST